MSRGTDGQKTKQPGNKSSLRPGVTVWCRRQTPETTVAAADTRQYVDVELEAPPVFYVAWALKNSFSTMDIPEAMQQRSRCRGSQRLGGSVAAVLKSYADMVDACRKLTHWPQAGLELCL